MNEFNASIVDLLNKECRGGSIYHVGLGEFYCQVSFGNVPRIQTNEEAIISLNGIEYSWNERLSEIPFGAIIGQTPIRFELIDPLVLRMWFKSSDYIEFHTVRGPNESVLIDFGLRDGAMHIELF